VTPHSASSPPESPEPRPAPALHLPGSPFGIAWFFLYGHAGVPAATFLPALRDLGAGFTKVYLFWEQIEPEKGRYDWQAVDAFAGQLAAPEEGLISLFSSSRWAVKRPSIMLPPSAAKNLDDYYRFVYATVRRCRGRVRYWQNDAEPNNPVFWSGTREEFVAQLKVFHRAVKDADPDAVVVVGGYDGRFIPPNLTPLPGQRTEPLPQQQAGLDFFDYVITEGFAAFDLFDLRLYGDPYTIVARVEYMRRKLSAQGRDKPVICTEYGGPNLFEFPENRPYLPLISTWSQAVDKTGGTGEPIEDIPGVNKIEQLYQHRDSLAPQTQMFMQGCAPELDAKYHRIQSRGVVMRNLLALSAGVQKTLYWELLAAPGKRDDLMTLMYGKIGLLGVEDGTLGKRMPTADVFARMAEMLAGVRAVVRVILPEQPTVFWFEVDRAGRGPLQVVWERRDAFSGEDSPAITVSRVWTARRATATDAFGETIPATVAGGRLSLPVSLTPIYLEPEN
jgi:hypothetical protein